MKWCVKRLTNPFFVKFLHCDKLLVYLGINTQMADKVVPSNEMKAHRGGVTAPLDFQCNVYLIEIFHDSVQLRSSLRVTIQGLP